MTSLSNLGEKVKVGLTASKFEKAVYKATNKIVEPPKRKHVRKLIIDSHHMNSSNSFYEGAAVKFNRSFVSTTVDGQ